MTIIAPTAARVEQNTAAEINRARQREIDRRLRYYQHRPREIPGRLAELHREWDIERAIEANAASIALGGLALGIFADRRFLAVPAAVAGFLLQHALQGWCPPVPVLRQLGFRTAAEICEERCGLKRLHDEYMASRGEPIPLPPPDHEFDEAVDAAGGI